MDKSVLRATPGGARHFLDHRPRPGVQLPMTTETTESAPEGTPPLYVNLSSGPSAAIGLLAGALYCLTFAQVWVYGQEYLAAWLAALLCALLAAMGYDYRRARALGMRRGDALVLALLGSVVYRLMLWLRARLSRGQARVYPS